MTRRLTAEAVLAEIFADSESESDFSDLDVTDDAVDESRESDSDEEPDPEPVQQRGPAYDYAPYDNWLMAFNGTAVGPKHGRS